jgi:hypothetical protein
MSMSEKSQTRSEGLERHSKEPENALTVLFGREDAGSGDGVEQLLLPRWPPPPAVRHAAKRINARLATEKDPHKARAILSRLFRDDRMEDVWKTLYSTRRVKNKTTEEFVYPAYVRHASHATRLRQLAEEATTSRGAALLEKEAVLIESEYDPFTHLEWSEQDIGIQLFFWHVYRSAVDLKPRTLSDLKTEVNALRQFAKDCRKIMRALRSRKMETEAVKLEEVATECDNEASSRESVDVKTDDPWLLIRDKGDVNLRTFIADLSIISSIIFGKPIRKVFFVVANVALERENITRSKVWEMLR